MNKYVKAIQSRAKKYSKRITDACSVLFATRQSVLDKYVASAPTPQTAVDLFKEDWVCRFPKPFDKVKAGVNPLFDDSRIHWAIEHMDNLSGKTVLELGPLEGAHSYMLQQQGAKSIVAIEANPKAYLRCLIVKETLGLDRVRMLCGDFIEYLRHPTGHYDVCLASGVLYHMRNPVELIALAAKSASTLILWTHYFDPAICLADPNLKPRFSTTNTAEYQGFRHTLHRYTYKSERLLGSFCGGPKPTSNWLSRDEIVACCRHFGYNNIKIGCEEPHHPHGPCFAIIASK